VVAGGAVRRTGGPAGLTAILVVLGGGPQQRHAIDAAHALGVRTVVCDSGPGVGDVPVSSEDPDGVRRVAERERADGLIAPGTDWPVRVAALVAAELGLPHPIDPATAVACTDKLAQRAALEAAGVGQPRWSDEAPPAFPCVVKAPDRQGQRAMTVLAGPDELAEAEARARAGSRSGRVLFEEFVPGQEVTVNGFSVDGAVTPGATTVRSDFPDAPVVAWRHVVPARAGADAAAAAAGAALAALGVRDGPSYVQLILSAAGPRIVEVAARLGGGHDSELVRRAVGVDLARAAVLAALGRPIDAAALRPRPRCACVIEFLRAPVGELVAVSAPDGVVPYHAAGHRYAPLQVATDRAGYLLACADSREEAMARAAKAADTVQFEIR
jgi:biotin carboxylase